MPTTLTTDKRASHLSAVLETPAFPPEVARAHDLSNLAVETDISTCCSICGSVGA